jgi:diguanylate cyclase (GGDEF)-like protein/PAS domain S-box-containing protein
LNINEDRVWQADDANDSFFHRLAENSPIGIYLVQDNKFRFVNREFEKATEFNRRELIGKDCLSLVDAADRSIVRDAAIEMLKGNRTIPYEYRVRTGSGKTIWILETVTSITYSGRRAAAGNFMNITERKSLEDKLRDQARHDSLTGLLNHGAIMEELQDCLSVFPNRSHAVIMADVRGLKQVNDQFGHQVGDSVLSAAAEALNVNGAIAGRYGGDEFVVILAGADQDKAADYQRLVDQTLKSFEILDERSQGRVEPRLTLGVAIYPYDGLSPRQLIAFADSAMYDQRRSAA